MSAPGTSPCPWSPAAGIDDQYRDLGGPLEKRQGIVDRARGLTARVPGHQHALSDSLEGAGVRDDEHRPPRAQDDALGKITGGAKLVGLRVHLAHDRHVRVSGVEGGDLPGLTLAGSPLRGEPGAFRPTLEQLLDASPWPRSASASAARPAPG